MRCRSGRLRDRAALPLRQGPQAARSRARPSGRVMRRVWTENEPEPRGCAGVRGVQWRGRGRARGPPGGGCGKGKQLATGRVLGVGEGEKDPRLTFRPLCSWVGGGHGCDPEHQGHRTTTQVLAFGLDFSPLYTFLSSSAGQGTSLTLLRSWLVIDRGGAGEPGRRGGVRGGAGEPGRASGDGLCLWL